MQATTINLVQTVNSATRINKYFSTVEAALQNAGVNQDNEYTVNVAKSDDTGDKIWFYAAQGHGSDDGAWTDKEGVLTVEQWNEQIDALSVADEAFAADNETE